MHINEITFDNITYPTKEFYPFNLEIFNKKTSLELNTPVTFFVGENGSGKSTLLRAIAKACRIHIWEDANKVKYEKNKYENDFYKHVKVSWIKNTVPGSFFASEIFNHFAASLDGWASSDKGVLDHFGKKSLQAQSHGQGHMAFFKNRYKIEGIYLLDEPENALSPKKQIELLNLLNEMGKQGHAQFIVATHSPILLSHPNSIIYDFDDVKINKTSYKATEHYRIYKEFMQDSNKFINTSNSL